MESNLRTRQEINNEYTQHAALLGDRVYKQILLQAEIVKLHELMNKLTQEQTKEEPLKEVSL